MEWWLSSNTSVRGTDRFLICLEFFVSLNCRVADGRGGGKVLLLSALVHVENGTLLCIVEHQELLLLLSR